MTTTLEQRLAGVTARLRAAESRYGRTPGSVALVAASKAHPAAAIRQLYQAGQAAFGESYLQEALAKQRQLQDLAIEWHFLGPVQSNKTRAIAGHFHWIHSLDRLKTARRLSEQRTGPPLQACLQVNICGEPQKAGVAPTELPALAEAVAALPGLRLRGLMALPAASEDATVQRRAFRALRQAWLELRAQGLALDTLSMGMSRDLEAAVAEGATVVRIGTDLFGERPVRSTV